MPGKRYLPLTIHPLDCDVYLLYAYVGAVCAIVIAIILNRVKSTICKKTVDKTFCRVLLYFIVFCAVDSVWGIIGTQSIRIPYLISTYGFHIMAAGASFVCSAYVLRNLDLPKKSRFVFQIVRFILLGLQAALLIQNLFTGLFFVIDENAVYHSDILRPISFYLQFCHYIPVIVYILIHIIFKKIGPDKAYSYRSSLYFTVLPLVFGFLQMLYPDGSFYGWCWKQE